jgi:hypothetical protein
MNTRDNAIIISSGISAAGIVTHDEHDITIAESVFTLEYLEDVIQHAKREIREYRKKNNIHERISQTQIEIKLFSLGKNGLKEPALHIRFKADNDPVIPSQKDRFYCIAPVVKTRRFKEYDDELKTKDYFKERLG